MKADTVASHPHGRRTHPIHDDLADQAREALVRCASLWGEPQLARSLAFVPGVRLRRSLGRCYPERAIARISPVVLSLPAPLQAEIFCHEAAHFVVFQRHGRGERPHGSRWKELMRAAGYQPRARIRLAPDVELQLRSQARPTQRFEHRCPVCHATRIARRRMSGWRCRACVTVGLEGLLVISPLPICELPL